MLSVPGYTLISPLQVHGANTFHRAVRDADRVAVILKAPLSESPTARETERYRSEHGILDRLRGVEGVVRAHDLLQREGRPVLVLEDFDGRPAQEPGRLLTVPAFLELAITLTRIVGAVHRHGVIHRDLKPEHILVTPSGAVRLIDFGCATVQPLERVDAAPPSLIQGTPAYMSPEQTGRMNRAVDYRTDFYSLGVTFYELLTGTWPLRGEDALGFFHAHIAKVPRPARELRSEIPPSLCAIVDKLMAKVAEERYQSAEGLAADLERCQKDLAAGKGELFPLGQEDAPARFQLPQRLYGREEAVATLLAAFARVTDLGRSELVLVRGYSGIGKSSVVHELHRPALERKGFFISGKFDQLQRDVPYATVAQAIDELSRYLLAGSDAELAGWRARLNAAWESNGQVIVDLAPRLALVAGEQPPVQPLPPTEAQNRQLLAFETFFAAFSARERPLILFLDDLQWADLASLRLLAHLCSSSSARVLLLGAYRDNEVDAAHPLARMLAELREAKAPMSEIELGPLPPAQVAQFLADALSKEPGEVAPLARLLHDKTGGNPFFLIQLVLAIHQDGLLTRDESGAYGWDEEAIARKGYSDNVVSFMIGKLERLSPEAQGALRLAAAVGNAFSLATIALVSGQGEAEVERALEPAFAEGLVARGGDGHLRFAHDRIQQAAYALVPDAERPELHLRIGRLLRRGLPPSPSREQLFDVVNHLNIGAARISDAAERHDLARLNADAGARAKASAANHAAITHLRAAYELIPGDPWETDDALAFQVSLSRAACELMTGNAAGARDLLDDLLPRARTRGEKARIYSAKSDIHVSNSESDAAVACILECLRLFGFDMSPHPSWEEVVAAHEEVWALMGDRPIESLVDLPLTTDPDIKAALGILAVLFAPAYFTDGNLLMLHLCLMVKLSLRHGNADASVHGYGWFGMITGAVFKRHREGYALGQVALDILERYDFAAFRGKALYTMEIINYWTRPISVSLDLVYRGFHHAALAGDFQVACYCCNHIVTDRVSLGHDLAEVYNEAAERLDFVRKTSFRDIVAIIVPAQRYVEQMRGRSASFQTMDGDGFEEQAFEAALTPDRMTTMRAWYWVLKTQGRFMCGAFNEAREAAEKAKELIWASLGHIQLLDYHLYRALAKAGGRDALSGEDLEAMREHRAQLDEWAGLCAENFRAPERMIAAEIARVTGQPDEAARAYDEAITCAREAGFIQNTGLAAELAARFWRGRRVPIAAEAYAQVAHDAYERWGAHGKVADLAEQWPHLAASAATRARPRSATTSYDADMAQLDALAVIKAQQAISREIELDRLVTTSMRIALESAGAQRGALLLARGDELVVEAAAEVSAGNAISATPADDSARDLPWSVLAYVKRTGEHVLLGDAARDPVFDADPYLSRAHVKAVLCVPLFRGAAIAGALYLENNLTADAFTSARVALVEHIASQAAISIENARLYAEVRRAGDELGAINEQLAQKNLALADENAERLRAEGALRAQQVTLQNLSTPIIQAWDGVLVLPVIGALESERAQQIMERLLAEIVRTRARFTILDLTGAEAVDESTVDYLLGLMRATSLLGSRCLVSGISPPVAQAMAGLGASAGTFTTFGLLRDALRQAVAYEGRDARGARGAHVTRR